MLSVLCVRSSFCPTLKLSNIMKQRACLKLIELLCLSLRNQVGSRAHLGCSPNLNLTAPLTDDNSFSLELKEKRWPDSHSFNDNRPRSLLDRAEVAKKKPIYQPIGALQKHFRYEYFHFLTLMLLMRRITRLLRLVSLARYD